MTNSECLDDDAISMLLEVRLGGAAAASVRTHLAACEACAELVGELVRDRGAGRDAAAFEEIGILGHQRGERVGERWCLEHWIGAGHMGSVWEVSDVRGEHPRRAVKLIRDDETSRGRLRREAKLLLRLQHPNIVRAFEWHETDAVSALVLERLRGETLDLRCARGGGLPFREGVGILRAVARGLAHAHAQGVAHRDLKPANVFVTSDPVRVLVVDLGLAAATAAWAAETLTRLTEEGASVGTPVYMAPEQLFGEDVDPRADVWALGLMAHEVICGSLPFEIGPVGKLLRALRRAPFDRLSARASVPTELDAAVQRWLSFSAADRGDSRAASNVLDDLGRSLDLGEPW